jgi:hypothetical protein
LGMRSINLVVAVLWQVQDSKHYIGVNVLSLALCCIESICILGSHNIFANLGVFHGNSIQKLFLSNRLHRENILNLDWLVTHYLLMLLQTILSIMRKSWLWLMLMHSWS